MYKYHKIIGDPGGTPQDRPKPVDVWTFVLDTTYKTHRASYKEYNYGDSNIWILPSQAELRFLHSSINKIMQLHREKNWGIILSTQDRK